MARLRAVVVVVVVLVLGAWTCQVPTDSPGSRGSADVPITTTGLTALVAGEDWHYVGEAGEPAFQGSWANFSGTPALAFRIREAGIVDIQGQPRNTSDPTQTIFTLPVGYRPSSSLLIPIVGDSVPGGVGSTQACLLAVLTNGNVSIFRLASGTDAPPQVPYIYAQLFIAPPAVA